MKRTGEILKLITGKRKGNEKLTILSEIENNEELQSVQSEFNELKNTYALLSSMKEMPAEEVDGLYNRFKEQLPPSTLLLKSVFIHYYKYAAILVLGMFLSFFVINLLSIDGNSLFNNELTTTVIADKDQISKIVLPDSTVVWINSGSKITYNNKFSVNNRKINLVGQAYFHAAKNKNIPLIVSADKLEVKVLGTKFDVCAYPEDENIKVLLESGKVQLCYKDDRNLNYELSPGDMVTYNSESKKFTTRKVEPQWYSSWKEGTLIFREKPMSEVITELQRRYNINIEVKDPKIYQSVFNAKINNEPLDKVLKSMEFSCSVKATIIRDTKNPGSKLKVILSKQ